MSPLRLSRRLSCLDKQAPLVPDEQRRISLHLFVDRASIDIFGNDGALWMPMGKIVPAGDTALEMSARGGTATIHALAVNEL